VVGAPRWNGTTFAAEAPDPRLPGCTMTWLALIVVPLVVPSTRTGWPTATALAAAELVPFWYVVDAASSLVTFWPADVEIMKPDPETLPTVPAAPPAAGPDRAFDPPAAPLPLALLLVVPEPVPEFALTIP